jgi:hypothetical protein
MDNAITTQYFPLLEIAQDWMLALEVLAISPFEN